MKQPRPALNQQISHSVLRAARFAGEFRLICRDLHFRGVSSGFAAKCAGNCAHGGTDYNPDRAGHGDADGGTCGRTGYQATSDKNRLCLAIRIVGIQRFLRCSIRVLGRYAVAGEGLLGKVFVNRYGIGWRYR